MAGDDKWSRWIKFAGWLLGSALSAGGVTFVATSTAPGSGNDAQQLAVVASQLVDLRTGFAELNRKVGLIAETVASTESRNGRIENLERLVTQCQIEQARMRAQLERARE